MLPERYRELLTAYVDGELSARQRRHALRLLRRSAEARRLLQRLQSDSDALIHLPRLRPDRDMTGPVLQKIAAARPLADPPCPPVRRRRAAIRSGLAPPRRPPCWSSSGRHPIAFSPRSITAAPPLPSPATAAIRPPTFPNSKPPTDGAHDGRTAAPPIPSIRQRPLPRRARPRTTWRTEAARPESVADLRKGRADLHVAGHGDVPRVEVRFCPATDVLSTFKLHELDEKKLLAALPKDALHVELPVPNANRAFERLQGVFKAHHVDLLIDATAEARLRHPNPKSQTNYILYTEDLTAEELAQSAAAARRRRQEGRREEARRRHFRRPGGPPHDRERPQGPEKLDGRRSDAGRPARRKRGRSASIRASRLSDQTGAQVAAALVQGKPSAKAASRTSPCWCCRTTPFSPSATPPRSSASWRSESPAAGRRPGPAGAAQEPE